jgi:hypothetical protein
VTELRSAQTILQNHDLGHNKGEVGDSIRREETVIQQNGSCRRASRTIVRFLATKAIERHRVIDSRTYADDHGDHGHQEEQELAGLEEISGRFGLLGFDRMVEVVAQYKHGDAIKEDESDEGRFANVKCVVSGNIIIGSAATVVAEQMIGL